MTNKSKVNKLVTVSSENGILNSETLHFKAKRKSKLHKILTFTCAQRVTMKQIRQRHSPVNKTTTK